MTDREKPIPQFTGIAFIAVVVVSACVTTVVLKRAWISDDAFITLRYVDNTLHGHGAVFNLGEPVQGFTHPLWFLMLLVLSSVFGNQISTAMVCGVVLTLAALVIWGRALLRSTHSPPVAIAVFLMTSLILVSSDPWVSFQTGGLENALSQLLIVLVVAECFFFDGSRPGRLVLILSLLCLSRPDFVFFSVPVGFLAIKHVRSPQAFRCVLLGAAPCIGWVLFAVLYYGDPIPNTAHAKLGIYSSWLYAVRQGAIYVLEWCVNDTLAAVGSLFLLASALVIHRQRRTVRAVTLGIICHTAYVVWVGGDFMRGRFMLPVLIASLVIGSLELAAGSLVKKRNTAVGLNYAVLLLVSVISFAVGDSMNWRQSPAVHGIVNERDHYIGYTLHSYLKTGRLLSSYQDLTFAEDLRAYAEACGPVTVHFGNPGTMGYLAGPKVTVIDIIGLTDRYIAQLPKSTVTVAVPRPGHPEKWIPVSYLASRRDVSILPEWEDRVRDCDCGLSEEAFRQRGSQDVWSRSGRIQRQQ